MLQKGLDIEEALDKIMKDKIVKEFEYLSKNGIDIRQTFKNWTRNYQSKSKEITEKQYEK